MSKDLPTFADLSPTQGRNLDEKVAVEHFLGKTQVEAECFFRENALYYQEDLMWMGDKGFAFYFPAFSSYLQSPYANGDSDALNCVTSVISFRLEQEPESIIQIREEILSLLDYCVDDFSKFGVEAEIYGDLNIRLVELRRRVSQLNPARVSKDR
jgi:hypothetical protein